MPELDIIEFRNKLVKSMRQLLEAKGFVNIKTNIENTAMGTPKTMFGQTPDITAIDTKNKFYIIQFAMTDVKDDDSIERLKAFGKYAKLHSSIFWLIIKKEAQPNIERRIRKLDLVDHVILKSLPSMSAL
ncbi:hypothetical protein HOH45_04730 [bacterium]|nr:hypothetical protein [bacterium]